MFRLVEEMAASDLFSLSYTSHMVGSRAEASASMRCIECGIEKHNGVNHLGQNVVGMVYDHTDSLVCAGQ